MAAVAFSVSAARFRAYADHMEAAEFADGMASLTELAAEKRTAMMYAEAVWWRCRRSLISDYLKACGWTVLHTFSATSTREHPYTSVARPEAGGLTCEHRLSA